MMSHHSSMQGMRAFLAMLPLVALAPFTSAQAAANPAGFAYLKYQDWTATDIANIASYGDSTGLLITGRCNRDHAVFAEARSHGAEVIVYLDVVEVPDVTPCTTDTNFYHPNGDPTPLWTPTRHNAVGHTMTDISAGSAWSDRVVEYVEELMDNPNIDGVFLDVVGARLWSSGVQNGVTLANWDTWPAAEQQLWTQGNVDLVHRIDVSRRENRPDFIVINNNFWDGAGPLGNTGEQYVDGVCSEHHDYMAAGYHATYLAKPFSNLGHRRVIAMATSAADALSWRTSTGVTHVSRQYTSNDYKVPPAAIASEFSRLTDRPKKFGRIDVAATPSAGMSANQKRGSKFTLSEPATLLSFSAYLDGNGGASGSQAVRMALYQDSGGVPGAKVAESSALNVTSGAAGNWLTFTAPAVALNPGNYWIVLHTGTTATIARNRGDGAANWYGNADTYSDGASSPFGTGSTGTVTLSVNVNYTVGN